MRQECCDLKDVIVDKQELDTLRNRVIYKTELF